MPFEKDNKDWEKRKNVGRKGYGIENAKKYYLQQSYYIINPRTCVMATWEDLPDRKDFLMCELIYLQYSKKKKVYV